MFNFYTCKRGGLWLPLFLFLLMPNAFALNLSDNESSHIGALIFQNECASQLPCLTSWNKGESFASLGIGHFIWYPKGVKESEKRFDESFPKFLAWVQIRGVNIPSWLLDQQGNPWSNRQQFNVAINTQKMHLLRDFLSNTYDFQIAFMQNRLNQALPSILKHSPLEKHVHIQQQFQYVATSPMGFYALMDYVNFKGEGTKPSERYHGKGWGLLQVLEHMQSTQSGLTAIQNFSDSAAFVLTRRVNLSSTSRHESRWLAGWKKRLQTYPTESKKYLLQ